MKEFLLTDILQKMMKQKQNLISLNPKLPNFFTDIFIPSIDVNTSIPFLPIRCFRDFNIHTGINSDSNTTFYSSGSTNNIQARHIFTPERLELYAKNSCNNFSDFLSMHNFSTETPIISLIPPTNIWTKSSLAAMIDMFRRNAFSITYCDVETNCQQLIDLLMQEKFLDNILIFGTTFHHLIVTEYVKKNNIDKIFKGTRLGIIDTGGTKGRTQSFSLDETIKFFRDTYGNPEDFYFLSEYGMCELGSQAWSIKKIHDGTFKCNNTLTPIAIDLKRQVALREGEYGFLAFFDLVNMDSWPTIITEDIACVVNTSEGIFHLQSRAPDATLKGCSLNVKDSFFFLNIQNEEEKLDKNVEKITSAKNFSSPQDIHNFIQNLNPNIWTPHGWSDLADSLLSWNEFNCNQPEKLNAKNILIICSSNIPITWLYPAKIATMLGAKSIHIKLPSIRSEDIFANSVRNKIADLVEKLSPYFYPAEIYLEKNKSISKDYSDFDYVIVFGSDSTISTFSKLLNNSKTKLIPQGDVKNSLIVDLHYSPSDVAKLCSLWHGRGCLTPICLFMTDRNSEQIEEWVHEFHSILENNFFERFKEEGITPKYLHDNQLLYTRAVIKNLGLEIEKSIFSGNFTHVFNLSTVTKEEIMHSRLDFSFGGCGFVYVLNSSLSNTFPQLSHEKITPSLCDKHGGKTWEEWFNL
ncbi:hypothetical protein QEJ31_00365 [Pigmentibacter sp. JX0631]|uniref:hypothetical protein n=1 Tax=Pigmentibacter sp. JX0631 TaxID=2976982 RepID=UPI0024692B12|nr:hypothetical protein [Pigmentibacter sp. JX0631]WGL60055.1 hypothetical protein QEJ31_00365 [Pigmentibacter sp. JX0631]